MKKKISPLLLLFILLIQNVNAQVTIGSNETPVAGALLDLKETGVTNKGLGMPKVALEDLTLLKPCVNSETATDRLSHIGLMVYNVNDNLCRGLHVWDGNVWTPIVPCPMPAVKFKFFQETAFSSEIYTEIAPTLEPAVNVPANTTIEGYSGVGVYWKHDLNIYSSSLYEPYKYIFSHMSPDPVTLSYTNLNATLNLYYKVAKTFKVIVKHINSNTGEVMAEEENYVFEGGQIAVDARFFPVLILVSAENSFLYTNISGSIEHVFEYV